MEQLGRISCPELDGLYEQGAAWTHRPNFDAAMELFCSEMVAFHSGGRLANLGMGHTLVWGAAVLIVYLDRARVEGATFTEIAQAFETGGLGGRQALKGAIDALLSGGLIACAPRPGDRRARELRPTEELLRLEHDNLVGRLKALELIQPQPTSSAAASRRSRGSASRFTAVFRKCGPSWTVRAAI